MKVESENEIIEIVNQISKDIRHYFIDRIDQPTIYKELMGEECQVQYGLNRIKKVAKRLKEQSKRQATEKIKNTIKQYIENLRNANYNSKLEPYKVDIKAFEFLLKEIGE